MVWQPDWPTCVQDLLQGQHVVVVQRAAAAAPVSASVFTTVAFDPFKVTVQQAGSLWKRAAAKVKNFWSKRNSWSFSFSFFMASSVNVKTQGKAQ